MATQQQLMEQLVLLTDAVRDLASRQVGADSDGDRAVTDADRIRQRVAFSYQALGALTGRTSSATGREFDVQIVAARRRPDSIAFRHLPADADWVELRSGGTVETLRIQRRSDSDNDHDRDCDWDADWDDGQSGDRGTRHDPDHPGRDGWRRNRHHGHVHPRRFQDSDPIGSMVFLRDRRGPLLAFGPRLGPLTAPPPPPTPQPLPYPPTGAEPAETIPEA
jgi:hypothetical protein